MTRLDELNGKDEVVTEGVVARHLCRRLRVQGRSQDSLTDTPLDSSHGPSEDGAGELHGLQGRWYCLVQAPLNAFGDNESKLKVTKAVPGAASMVQVPRSSVPSFSLLK